MSDFQVRLSVLNVPGDLSALKLRGWLQAQAREIQEASGENAYVQIKLFLTKKQRFALTPKKLDSLLTSIVDGYSAIHTIELKVVDEPLTAEQMTDAVAEATAEFQEMMDSLEKQAGVEKAPTVH
jgi:hypothetical protein